MASHCHKRNTKLLYADLFKSHKSNNNNNNNIIILDGSSSSSCDSSSSGFTTPFGSELGSFGSEDEDFMAELTRQMAECMLKEEEEEEETDDNIIYEDFEPSGPVKNYLSQRYMDSSSINNFKNGLYSTPFYAEDQMSHFQVNQLKNQPPVTKQGWSVCGVKGSSTVLAQQKQVRKTEQNYIQYRGKGPVGSGMKAIFLGESGSSNGPSGTGVFLPRSPNDPTQVKKKSGCSTVLIPTRVLQTLELHFSKISNSTTPLSCGTSRGVGGTSRDRDKCKRSQENGDPKLENCVANKEEDMQLPQEWTY